MGVIGREERGWVYMGWGDVDWIGVSGGLSPGGERQGEVGDTWDEGRLDKGKWGT